MSSFTMQVGQLTPIPSLHATIICQVHVMAEQLKPSSHLERWGWAGILIFAAQNPKQVHSCLPTAVLLASEQSSAFCKLASVEQQAAGYIVRKWPALWPSSKRQDMRVQRAHPRAKEGVQEGMPLVADCLQRQQANARAGH